MEKILVTVPERYEASITTLENTKDLSKITLAGVLHALRAQEQRRLMRQDHVVEGALPAKHHEVGSSQSSQSKDKGKKKNYPPCEHCGKMGHPPFRCWRRPDAKCNKCNQLGHEVVICKGKFQQPEANAKVVEHGEEDKVYLLKKTLFRLKQAPRAWYSRINEHLLSIGFVKSLFEATLYVKHKGKKFLIVSLYVDDLLVTGDDTRLVEEFKQEMMQVFEMTDLGLMSYFLGIEIKQNEDDVFICQKKYAKEILKKFQMEECKAVSTPMKQKEKLSKEDGVDKVDEGYYMSLIGCLMYLTTTRTNILFAISLLSRFMHCASEMHLKAARRVLRYIFKGTVNYGVKFESCQNFKLCGFSDSDWAGSIDDMKSSSRYCFSLGS